MVYVPVVGIVTVSMNPPPAPNVIAATSTAPFGLMIETLVAQQLGPTLTLTFWLETASKVTPAF